MSPKEGTRRVVCCESRDKGFTKTFVVRESLFALVGLHLFVLGVDYCGRICCGHEESRIVDTVWLSRPYYEVLRFLAMFSLCFLASKCIASGFVASDPRYLLGVSDYVFMN